MAKRGRKKKVDNENSVDILELEAGLKVSDRQLEDANTISSQRAEQSTNENDVTKDEVGKKEVISPPTFRNPLELDLSTGFSSVEFIYPHLRGYWASEEDVPNYLRHGYQFCKREWVKNYDSIFPFSSPGEGSSPNGMVPHKGLVLMVASEEIANERTEFYRRKIVDPREEIKGNLSEEEISKHELINV